MFYVLPRRIVCLPRRFLAERHVMEVILYLAVVALAAICAIQLTLIRRERARRIENEIRQIYLNTFGKEL